MLLRLGCSLVAWMVVYTHCIWLATLGAIGCGSAGDELLRLLFGFVPFTIGFSFLLSAINPVAEVARILRWLALPLALLIGVAALPVITFLQESTFGSEPICSSGPAAWHRWWAPAQLLTLSVVGLMAFRVWRKAYSQPNQ